LAKTATPNLATALPIRASTPKGDLHHQPHHLEQHRIGRA
jgi:hypothetical protein